MTNQKDLLILVLIAVVIALILFSRSCNDRPSGNVDIELIYDSIERVIMSDLPIPDTIEVEKEVVRWLPSATIYDTIYIDGETRYIYNDAPIDTASILKHYLTQAVTYTDTIRDSSLQAVIRDTIFRNSIVAREFIYKILRPIEIQKIDNRDKFQMIASFQAGGGMTYGNTPNALHVGADLGLKFNGGTYFSVGYMAGTSHYVTIRAGQVIRFRKL